ncbi:MAG: pyridoxamine 5'-phosphate oxidase family protein [Sneathiellales bacterium]|nr:pyridoxamine 5'-phosphate oxidase family protein [Sneathiellales bacterium]
MSDTGWTQSETPFHKGEIKAQRRVGVDERIGQYANRVIRPYMPDQHREFFHQLPILYLGFTDAEGWPWGTALEGRPGFVTSPDPETLEIRATPSDADIFSLLVEEGMKTGVLGLEMHTRRRNRMNATVSAVRDEGITLKVDQSFGNCPQYIRTRDFSFRSEAEKAALKSVRTTFTSFKSDIVALIEQSETFFVASSAGEDVNDQTGGCDMSHRGGQPGFVKVDGKKLYIPDYLGNFHFNTLGNFELNPKAGLLFLDYDSGDMLQLTGTVEICWSNDGFEHFKGSERGWIFTLEKGQLITNHLSIQWGKGEPSLNSLMTGTWSEAASLKQEEETRNEWKEYEVVDTEEESTTITSFYLKPLEGRALVPFKPGQFLPLQVPAGESGEALVRTYTLSSSPLDESYRISVKKEGVVSTYLHEKIRTGDRLFARSPRGRFYLNTTEDRPAFLIAAGVGITPMMSMLRTALQEGYRTRHMRPITLVHGARCSQARAFYQEISALVKSSNGTVRFASLLTYPAEEEIPGIHYQAQGRVNKEVLLELIPNKSADYYLCGPEEFMQEIYNHLRALGVPDQDIHAESFGPSALKREDGKNANSATSQEALVSFSGADEAHLWTEEEGSLLDFAEKQGLEPSFGCRSGRCGSCAVRLLGGQIRYQEDPEFQPEEGEILLCCARPAAGETEILLDL